MKIVLLLPKDRLNPLINQSTLIITCNAKEFDGDTADISEMLSNYLIIFQREII